MKRPLTLQPGEETTHIGTIFGAPLVVKGWSWLPWAEAAAWAVMTHLAARRRPDRSPCANAAVGALAATAFLGAEWCHNLAHAAAAQWIGKPTDAVLIVGGMPLLEYYDVNDNAVTPRQHILRALGGPLFNLCLLPLAWVAHRLSAPGSAAREVAATALGANAFLGAASLLPIPGIDGGPIVKWALVERGLTPPQADEHVRRIDRALSGGLAAAAGVALKKRRWLAGGTLALFAALALAIGLRWIEE